MVNRDVVVHSSRRRIDLAAVACGLLFVTYRRFRSHGTAGWFVAAGLLIRAVLGQVIFWISYSNCRLRGDCTWAAASGSFALDGAMYFDTVSEVTAREGVAAAIFSLDAYGISPGFRKILTLMGVLFGHVPSTALLLNIAAYLGTCAIVIALAGDRRRVATIAVAGISLSPAMILWSTQPLKDVLFSFLLAAFVASVAYWISAWNREENGIARAAVATLAMPLVLCAIASVRWYIALLLLVSLPILIVVSLRARTPLRALALLLIMMGAVFAGAMMFARPHMPGPLLAVMTSPARGDAARLPRLLADGLKGARFAFDTLSGSTTIAVGPALRETMSPGPARFVSGCAALLLPRAIAQGTGLVEIGGGRGLWLFADIDTLFFDVFLVTAIAALLRSPRMAKWRNPLLWLVVLMTVAIAGAFVYTVGNFGALFRYRSMIFIAVVLIPVVAARAERRRPS